MNIPPRKNMAMVQGDADLPSSEVQLKARVTRMTHHECIKLLEGD